MTDANDPESLRYNNPPHPLRLGLPGFGVNNMQYGKSQIEFEDEDPDLPGLRVGFGEGGHRHPAGQAELTDAMAMRGGARRGRRRARRLVT